MRLQNSKNTTLKYKVFAYNMVSKTWDEVGEYTSYRDIADKLNYSYDIIRDIALGRSKKLGKFIRVEKIKKVKEENKAELQ